MTKKRYLYFAQFYEDGHKGAIKVGVSCDPYRRCQELERYAYTTGMGYKNAVLLGLFPFPDPFKVERYLLNKYQKRRVNGSEWIIPTRSFIRFYLRCFKWGDDCGIECRPDYLHLP